MQGADGRRVVRRYSPPCLPSPPHGSLFPCLLSLTKQEVQPSRDVARVAHEKDFARHEATLAALAALRGKGHGGWAK